MRNTFLLRTADLGVYEYAIGRLLTVRLALRKFSSSEPCSVVTHRALPQSAYAKFAAVEESLEERLPCAKGAGAAGD